MSERCPYCSFSPESASDYCDKHRPRYAAPRAEEPPPGEGLPYPVDDGGTHWDGCWRERGHHNCAVAEIERLRGAAPTASAAAAEPDPQADVLKDLRDDLEMALERVRCLQAALGASQRQEGGP